MTPSFLESIFAPPPAPPPPPDASGWDGVRQNTAARRARARGLLRGGGRRVERAAIGALLAAVIEPGDRVAIEGNNQKQADFLARALAGADPARMHDLHMVQSVLALPEHLELFARGIARRADFCYSAPQAAGLSRLLADGRIEIGAIHTYLEQYARYFMDLTPRVALVAADAADAQGNLFTGYNTEDTPVLCEATKFRDGLVIAQVNAFQDTLPRVDIPGDWVDYLVEADRPYHIEPLFTRDPQAITDTQVLMAMLCLKGIYAPYAVRTLNHGVGFNTAAIELLLPTYGAELGLKRKVCTHFLLNPHPTLIPAIESGWVDSVYAPGGELGMEAYVRARPDVFFVGPDGHMRSNRAYAQVAGLYGVDLFVGATLQVDQYGNSSTATAQRIVGFGGAPNIGGDAHGRRHDSPAWRRAGAEFAVQPSLIGPLPRGKKLVVQMVETFAEGLRPTFVERLDAWTLAETCGFPQPPVMIYGDDITHLVTEEGIAALHRCRSLEERMAAVAAVAGYTEIGRRLAEPERRRLRAAGLVQTPDDLGIDRRTATTERLAARSLRDLVRWSGGLYEPPRRFHSW